MLKRFLLGNWQIIEKQPKLQEVYKGLPTFSIKGGKSFMAIPQYFTVHPVLHIKIM